jgi:hypothetical protein
VTDSLKKVKGQADNTVECLIRYGGIWLQLSNVKYTHEKAKEGLLKSGMFAGKVLHEEALWRIITRIERQETLSRYLNEIDIAITEDRSR